MVEGGTLDTLKWTVRSAAKKANCTFEAVSVELFLLLLGVDLL
jgi:hypothetical protein